MAEAAGQLLVADASLVVPLVAPESGSEAARALLSGAYRWISPSLLIAEVTSALHRKVIGNELTGVEAERSLGDLLDAVDDGAIRLVRDEDLASAALRIAVTEGHKVWDCFYVALAESEQAALATADRKQARIAETRGIELVRVDA
jgi:predicted nucleic acid-binding protein